MQPLPKFCLWLLLIVVGFNSVTASNGLNLTGYGPRYLGLGGTNLAIGGSSMDLQSNPANLYLFQRPVFEFGSSFIYAPSFNYSDYLVTGDPSLDYQNDRTTHVFAPVPYLGIVYPVSKKITIGFAAYGQGGTAIKMDGIDRLIQAGTTFIRGKEVVESEASIIKITPGFAYNHGRFSVGAAVDISRGQIISKTTWSLPLTNTEVFKQKFESDPAWQFGFKLGVTYNVTERFRIAYAYISKNEYVLKGKFELNGPATISTDAKTKMTLPDKHAVGLSYRTGAWLVGTDFSYYRYSRAMDVETFDFDGVLPTSTVLYDFKDQFVMSIGAEYTKGSHHIRFGYNYGNSPVSNNGLSLTFYQVLEHHVSLGSDWKFGKWTVDGAIELAFSRQQSGSQSSDWSVNHGFGTSGGYNVKGILMTPSIGVKYEL